MINDTNDPATHPLGSVVASATSHVLSVVHLFLISSTTLRVCHATYLLRRVVATRVLEIVVSDTAVLAPRRSLGDLHDRTACFDDRTTWGTTNHKPNDRRCRTYTTWHPCLNFGDKYCQSRGAAARKPVSGNAPAAANVRASVCSQAVVVVIRRSDYRSLSNPQEKK